MRKALFKAHLWTGLIVGLLWSIQGLTGAMYVFAREADRLFLPSPSGAPMASPDVMIRAAEAAAPGGVVTRLSINDKHFDTVNVLYTTPDGAERAVVEDAGSGRIIGRRDMEPWTPFTGSASRWIYLTHLTLLGGDNGELLVGISGLLLFTSAISGLYIAWPRRRAWRQLFAWRKWKKTEHKLFGWHRLVGLFVAFGFIAMAATGAFLAFPEEPVRHFVARFASYRPIFSPAMMDQMNKPPTALQRGVSATRALEIASQRFPRAHWTRIFMPTADNPIYVLRLYQPGEIRAWLGATEVEIAAGDGRVLGVYDAVHAPISNKVFDGSFDVHSGAIAGLPGRILVLLLGLSLPTLYVTGVWAWFGKRQRRKARQSSRDRMVVAAAE